MRTGLEAPGERSCNVDVLRALAALAVLQVHASALQGRLFSFQDRQPWHLLVNNGTAGVWLFFVLSGYLIAGPFITAMVEGRPLPSVGRFAARRVARIWPAYVVALTVVIGATLPPGTRPHAWQLPVHYLLLHNLVPGEFEAILTVAWTLSVEALFYAFVPAVAWLVRRWRGSQPVPASTVAGAIGVVWATSIIWMLVGDFSGTSSTALWVRDVFPAMLGPFCPGMLIALGVGQWRRTGEAPGLLRVLASHRRASLTGVLAIAVGAAYVTTGLTAALPADVSRELFSVAAGIVLVLALTRGPLTGVPGRILAWLGLVSYGIYLWQGVTEALIGRYRLWVPLPHPGVAAYVAHVVYLTVVTVPVAAASWYLLERPVIETVRRRLARRQPMAPMPTPAGDALRPPSG